MANFLLQTKPELKMRQFPAAWMGRKFRTDQKSNSFPYQRIHKIKHLSTTYKCQANQNYMEIIQPVTHKPTLDQQP